MNEEYGLKGNVQRLEQRRQSKFDSGLLQHTPDHNSFDVEFSLLGQILRETSYTHGGLLHRSTRFHYDEAGGLIRTENFDSAGASLGCSEYVYSEAKCERVSRDATGVITGRRLEEYDGKKLVRLSTFDGKSRPNRIKTFEYSDNRLSKSDSRYFLPDGTWYERCLTDYDSAARIHRTYGLKSDGTPLGDGKYVHEYSEDGRVSKVWSFNEFNDDNIASHVTIYEYLNDEAGNWIERHESHLWRNGSYQSRNITTRKLTYYPEKPTHT